MPSFLYTCSISYPSRVRNGSERFPVQIAFGRVTKALRPRALNAFEEFLFSRARDVYPRYDFARMTDDEYGAVLALD